MMRLGIWLAVALVARASGYPVCVRPQLVGEWSFKISAQGPTPAACDGAANAPREKEKELIVRLFEPDRANALKDAYGGLLETELAGKWTIVDDRSGAGHAYLSVHLPAGRSLLARLSDGDDSGATPCNRSTTGWFSDGAAGTFSLC